MAKEGRFYVTVDVNWYDEWGYQVSTDAALLWVLALGQAKRINSATLTLSQLRRVAPDTMPQNEFSEAVAELSGCDSPPISGDGMAIVLHGFEDWNDTSGASQNGIYGNHIRWHVNACNPSETCEHCLHRGDSLATSPPDRYREEKRREEKNIRATSSDDAKIESDFNECWQIYPRKLARKASLKAYIAQRRKAVPADTLLTAVQNFAVAMQREGRAEDRILYGSTFFGPSDRWEDYIKPPEPEPVEQESVGAGALFASEAEAVAAYGERVYLPGESRG